MHKDFSGSFISFLDRVGTNDLLITVDYEQKTVTCSKNFINLFQINPRCVEEICSLIHIDDLKYFLLSLDDTVSEKTEVSSGIIHLKNANNVYLACRYSAKLISKDYNQNVILCSFSLQKEEEYFDSVTGLKRINYLHHLIGEYNKHNSNFLTLGVEIIKFHDINSIYGYHYGNKVLYLLSRRFEEYLNDSADIYRLEGTKFAIILKGASLEKVKEIFEKLKFITQNIEVDGLRLNLILNGIVINTTKYNDNAQDLIGCLISSFSKIQNNYHLLVLDEDYYDNDNRRLEFLNSIKASIINNCESFYLTYQALVSSLSGKIIGAEALLRWNHEKYGQVLPYQFIEYIEMQPCFYELGCWIIKKALIDVKEIIKSRPNFFININLSYSQLEREEFKYDVIKIIEELEFPYENLQFELTERCRDIDAAYLFKQLQFFKEKGIKIALDDFGTGIASIDLLCNMPISTVKIDQTFIKNILVNSSCKSVVEMALQCAKKLGINVCLEGVENKEIHNYVARFNATYHQGYYYSKPIVFEDFLKEINKIFVVDEISVIKTESKYSFEINNILSMVPGGFFMYLDDENKRITNINEAILDIYECATPEEFRELTKGSFKGMIHPDDYEKINREIYEQINSSNKQLDYVEYRIITKNGKVKNVIDYGHLVKGEYEDDIFYVFIAEKH